MEVQGKIIVKLPLQSGTSKAGNAWTKQEYVLETVETYPRKIHFDFFGDRVNQYPLEVGDFIVLSFDIESREFNGRWFTNIRGWKAEKRDPNAVAGPVAAQNNDPFSQPQSAAPFSDNATAAQQPVGTQQNFMSDPASAKAAPAQDPAGAGFVAENSEDDLPF